MRGIVIALLIIAISAISFAEIGPGRYQGPVKYHFSRKPMIPTKIRCSTMKTSNPG